MLTSPTILLGYLHYSTCASCVLFFALYVQYTLWAMCEWCIFRSFCLLLLCVGPSLRAGPQWRCGGQHCREGSVCDGECTAGSKQLSERHHQADVLRTDQLSVGGGREVPTQPTSVSHRNSLCSELKPCVVSQCVLVCLPWDRNNVGYVWHYMNSTIGCVARGCLESGCHLWVAAVCKWPIYLLCFVEDLLLVPVVHLSLLFPLSKQIRQSARLSCRSSRSSPLECRTACTHCSTISDRTSISTSLTRSTPQRWHSTWTASQLSPVA